MPFGPPPGPPPGPLPSERVDDATKKRLKERDGAENRRVVGWVCRTARPYLRLIIVMMVFAVAGSLASIAFALASQATIDSAVAGDMNALIAFAVLLAVITLGQIVVRALSSYWGERVNATVANGYRSRAFGFILDRDYAQISRYHSGELMNRFDEDVNIVVNGVTSFLPSIAEIVANLIGAGTVLLVMDWRFLIVYVVCTIALIVVNRVFRSGIKRLTHRVREADGRMRSFFQDGIQQLLVLRAFATEDATRARGQELLDATLSTRLKRSWVQIKANSAMGLSMNFGHVFALIWCSFCLVGGTMSYGSLVAIMQLTGQVRQPFLSASNLSSQYYAMIASGERLMELEALKPELTDAERKAAEAMPDAQHMYAEMASLEFTGLGFSYGEGAVLEGIDFSIDKGDVVAIMGHSGCGKSTLFKLILGMYRPSAGSAAVVGAGEGGAWRYELGPLTRRLFAYVPQGNLLISGRLRDNVAFARPGATDEEVWEALRVACASEFVERLPHGLDTQIGEHGGGLSEGQTQRIAVARAYLSGAPVMLLDEATSALDEATEAQLLHNLQQLRNRTCLIVTHRPAALTICTKKLALE